MKNKIIIILTLLCLTSCTDKKSAEEALTNMGFNEIEITGYKFFSCGKDDFYHTGFKARNIHGNLVEGTVCSGLFFKDATVRF
jgi:hypothetical protein